MTRFDQVLWDAGVETQRVASKGQPLGGWCVVGWRRSDHRVFERAVKEPLLGHWTLPVHQQRGPRVKKQVCCCSPHPPFSIVPSMGSFFVRVEGTFWKGAYSTVHLRGATQHSSTPAWVGALWRLLLRRCAPQSCHRRPRAGCQPAAGGGSVLAGGVSFTTRVAPVLRAACADKEVALEARLELRHVRRGVEVDEGAREHGALEAVCVCVQQGKGCGLVGWFGRVVSSNSDSNSMYVDGCAGAVGRTGHLILPG